MIDRIVILCLNPSLDFRISIYHFISNEKNRVLSQQVNAAGGGINIGRVLKRFGAEPLVIFPIGGESGQQLKRLVAAENLRHLAYLVEKESRTNFTVNEESSHAQYLFALAGPQMSELECSAALALTAHFATSGFVIASGSLPPGAPSDSYAQLARYLKQQGNAKLVLDTSGPALKQALKAGVYLLKTNLSEFADLTDKQLDKDPPDLPACLKAARRLLAEGAAENIALTLGKHGAMIVTQDRALYAPPPPVKVQGSVGAGDSFLAVMVLYLAQRKCILEAFRHAVAAGSAALLAPNMGLAARKDVTRLARKVNIRKLPYYSAQLPYGVREQALPPRCIAAM